MLVVQGSRDSFGTEAELGPVLARMPSAELYMVEGGDYSLNIRRKSAPPREAIYATVMDKVVRWVRVRMEVTVTWAPRLAGGASTQRGSRT